MAAATPKTPPDPAVAARRARRRKRRRVIFLAVVALLLGAGVWVKFEIDRIDREAEQFSATGQGILALFKKYGTAIGNRDVDGVLACLDPEYRTEAEGTWAERIKSDRDGVKVFTWHADDARPFERSDVGHQYKRLFAAKPRITESKIKLSWIEHQTGDEATVKAAMLLAGQDNSGTAFEAHVWLRLGLRKGPDGWLVRSHELLHGETVTGDRRGFTDVTASAGIDFQAHHNPLWADPEWAPARFEIMKYATAGVSTADFDNDGWYDLFFCDARNPRFYRNNGDGTFTDVTARAGLPTELHGCSVAIFADFDNDGWKDLFLGVGTGMNRLYRNVPGTGPSAGRLGRQFEDVTEGAGLGGMWVSVAAAADYDNDGRVDLYLGRYLDPRKNLPTTLFYTRNGEGNSLLRNPGGFKFTDATAAAGVREGGLTLGVAWGDYDRDGHLDLFVANDFGRNALFHSNGNGTFSDVSRETGALDFGYSMSAYFGDINNDTYLDVYVSKVHSGQRWYGHAPSMHKYMLTSLRERTFGEDFPIYRELYGLVGSDWHTLGEKWIRGNSLLLNDGTGKFRDVGEEARASPFGWYWASAMFDYDNDGLQDIYAVNGWITGKTKDDL
jgi:ketosteroid isomerase-like protein